ncbi:MAG: F0F1 ATP synthase subunit delta [Candidatus Jorgensenbacteria bacterium]
MKYTPKQYARALYELLAAGSEKDSRAVIKKLVGVLSRNNDLSKEEEILRWFEKIYHEETGKPLVEVSAADEKLKELLGKKIKGELVFKKDPRVLGGVRIKIGDEMIDNTIKVRLERLREALSK